MDTHEQMVQTRRKRCETCTQHRWAAGGNATDKFEGFFQDLLECLLSPQGGIIRRDWCGKLPVGALAAIAVISYDARFSAPSSNDS